MEVKVNDEVNKRDHGEADQERGIEIEPSEVTDTTSSAAEDDNQIKWSHYAVLTQMLSKPAATSSSSTVKQTKTPGLKNTMLHKAAWRGDDDIVDMLVHRYPNLLFILNDKNDTVLHVAARAGKVSTIRKLLAAYANYQHPEIAKAWVEYHNNTNTSTTSTNLVPLEHYDARRNMEDLLEFVKKENVEGNTMLHEAMICGKNTGAKIFQAFQRYKIKDPKGEISLSQSCYKYALHIVNLAKQSVLYLAVQAGDMEAVELILDNVPESVEVKGISPVVAAILRRDKAAEMLSKILDKKPSWRHLIDQDKRLPLHYAASIGYLEGVRILLDRCPNHCLTQSDKYGYFPIHLASHGDHVKVVKELVEHCSDVSELADMLDNSHRNILHIAAKDGKNRVVRYILRHSNVFHELINQKDNKGDTPLHLATRSYHPKIVYRLTWNKSVELNLFNHENETALDIINKLYQQKTDADSLYQLEGLSFIRQQLTWIALKSAGAKSSRGGFPRPEVKKDSNDHKVSNPEKFSNRVENLTLVSTLVITASVAACLAVPGEAEGGKANNLSHIMFQLFILFITISLFSSISATIILFWTQLGITELVIFCLKIVMPLLGIALISLCLAFMAGLYTVISKLTWLATTFLIISVICIVVISLLYSLLFFPQASENRILRYISHFPFLILASMVEPKPKSD